MNTSWDGHMMYHYCLINRRLRAKLVDEYTTMTIDASDGWTTERLAITMSRYPAVALVNWLTNIGWQPKKSPGAVFAADSATLTASHHTVMRRRYLRLSMRAGPRWTLSEPWTSQRLSRLYTISRWPSLGNRSAKRAATGWLRDAPYQFTLRVMAKQPILPWRTYRRRGMTTEELAAVSTQTQNDFDWQRTKKIVIVVEGRDDTSTQTLFDETWDTRFCRHEHGYERIQRLSGHRFTDPDSMGSGSAVMIMTAIPTVQHAFLKRQLFPSTSRGSLGTYGDPKQPSLVWQRNMRRIIVEGLDLDHLAGSCRKRRISRGLNRLFQRATPAPSCLCYLHNEKGYNFKFAFSKVGEAFDTLVKKRFGKAELSSRFCGDDELMFVNHRGIERSHKLIPVDYCSSFRSSIIAHTDFQPSVYRIIDFDEPIHVKKRNTIWCVWKTIKYTW